MMMRRRRKWRRRRMRRALYLTGLWESCVAAAKVSMVLMCTFLLEMCSTAESCCFSPAQTGVFWFGSSAHGLPPPFHSCPDSALQQGNHVLSVQSQLCPTLCDPVDCSTPGFLVYHKLPKPAQTYAIQLFHPLSFPYPPAFNVSQHQGLF